jgi:hypothetical protein
MRCSRPRTGPRITRATDLTHSSASPSVGNRGRLLRPSFPRSWGTKDLRLLPGLTWEPWVVTLMSCGWSP